MAASTNPIAGENYLVQISTDSGVTYEDLGFQTDGGINRTAESIERSSKNNCAWASSRAGRRGWSISGSGLLSNGSITNNLTFNEVEAIWAAGTTVPVKVTAIDCDGNPLVDETEWTGEAYFTTLDQTHPDQQDSGYTFTLQGTEALTSATITG